MISDNCYSTPTLLAIQRGAQAARVPMTPTDLASWRHRMGYTQREAAAALGVQLPAYQQWERGARFRDARPVVIDRRTELACAALAAGITGYSESVEP